MRYCTLLIAGCVGLLSATLTVHAQAQTRSTPAFRLTEGKSASFDVRGLGQGNASRGDLDIDYKNGHAMIHLEMDSLVHPQRVGTAYSAYVLWGVTTDGKVTRLGEIAAGKKVDLKADFTAQTFGLIATAEPYAEVELPSPVLVLRFTLLDKADKHAPMTSSARFLGDNGDLYVDAGRTFAPDFTTPLLVLSARHAVEVARRAGAVEYAPTEWRQVDVKLEALEQVWPDQRNDEAKFSGPAREVIRLADGARRLSTERAGGAATTATLERAADDVVTAEKQKEDAQLDAAFARASADSAGEVTDSIRIAAAAAAAAAEQAATVARQDADAAWAGLATSISAVLDTKREARGLVVNLSGVYFTTGEAGLQPVARENLSKLSGIMLGYPGPYTLAIGGHTDAVGSDAMNDQLSLARAESVRSYLIGAGITASHLYSTVGFGERQPVADNATVDGRARNRRVEIVIVDTDLSIR